MAEPQGRGLELDSQNLLSDRGFLTEVLIEKPEISSDAVGADDECAMLGGGRVLDQSRSEVI